MGVTGSHVSFLDWVTGAETGRAAPRALGVGGGAEEEEEFELRSREVKGLRYRERQPVGGTEAGSSLARSWCGVGVGLAALHTLPKGCWMPLPGISVEPSCQDSQQRL